MTISTITSTKLRRPKVVGRHVHRPRLLNRLEERSRLPLALVSAPAGYGKTFLLSCWLEASGSPSAWVSLDKSENDLRLFLSYVLAAIQTLFPDAGHKTLNILNALTLPPVGELAGNLINELDLIEQPFILVLDDFHCIKDESVLDLVTQLLHHPPGAMHLVLSCRRDPSLPISRLRAQGLVAEIRTRDLRFNNVETETFLKELGIKVDSSTAVALQRRTEGWVTGLRLAALAMRHRDNLDPRLLEPHVDSQYVMEYLFTEVFSRQPTEVSRYLLSVSILDRFCGALCEAVGALGHETAACQMDGWEFIAWLKKENMFLSPLDPENRWFRFHHLYKTLLFNQLKRRSSPQDISDLHARASAWFAENGLIDEALSHALAGGDPLTAGRLIARQGVKLMNNEQWPTLDRWLRLLPAGMIDQDPELLLLLAWTNMIYSRYEEMATCLDQAEVLMRSAKNVGKHIQGPFEALRSIQQYQAANGERALMHASRACDDIPRDHRWARMFAFTLRAVASQMVGDREKAFSTIETAMRDPELDAGGSQDYFRVSSSFVYWQEADLSAMLQTASQWLKVAQDGQTQKPTDHGLYFSGIAHYHRNELQIAEEELSKVVNAPYSQHAWNFAHSAFALALTYQAESRKDDANEVGASVVSYALSAKNPVVLAVARAFQAELALRQGRLAEASKWAEQFVAKPFTAMYRFYVPQLTLIRVLLAQDTTDSREQAADLLKQLYDFVVSIHNTRFQIDVLALQALLCDTRGEKSDALKRLTEALALSEPGGFIRLFVDLGPQMADLLKWLVKQNVAVDYIGRILSAFRDDELGGLSVESDHPGSRSLSSVTQPLVEPLTKRELEILEILTQRLSNKEIAAKLFISPETTKKHLNNIYGKLNVTNRRQAVEKARALSIV